MKPAPALEELRFVTEADVYKAGVRAAAFRRAPSGEVTFHYLPEYDGAPIASTLPVSTEELTRPGGGLPPFFAGLLPEGHRLSVLRRAVKASADDELSVLLAVGADLPGDIQVFPTATAAYDAPALMEEDPARLDFRALTGAPDRQGIPGVQAKSSATMLTAPLPLRNRPALLKIDPPEYPHLVRNEAAHLTAARALRIPVAQHDVVIDRYGVPGLLVARSDRDASQSGLRRYAMEDAAQVLGILPAAKYTVSSEEAVLALAQRCTAPLIAARTLYLQFLFAWLTGNGDLHAKNLSILQAPSGRWEVAPVYDIPCTALYRDFSMALLIDGRHTRIRARHWDAFADSIGLRPPAARSAQRLALTAAAKVDLAALPFEGSPLHSAQRELRMRRSELSGSP